MPNDPVTFSPGYIDRATARRIMRNERTRGAKATKNTGKPKRAGGRRKGGGKRR